MSEFCTDVFFDPATEECNAFTQNAGASCEHVHGACSLLDQACRKLVSGCHLCKSCGNCGVYTAVGGANLVLKLAGGLLCGVAAGSAELLTCGAAHELLPESLQRGFSRPGRLVRLVVQRGEDAEWEPFVHAKYGGVFLVREARGLVERPQDREGNADGMAPTRVLVSEHADDEQDRGRGGPLGADEGNNDREYRLVWSQRAVEVLPRNSLANPKLRAGDWYDKGEQRRRAKSEFLRRQDAAMWRGTKPAADGRDLRGAAASGEVPRLVWRSQGLVPDWYEIYPRYAIAPVAADPDDPESGLVVYSDSQTLFGAAQLFGAQLEDGQADRAFFGERAKEWLVRLPLDEKVAVWGMYLSRLVQFFPVPETTTTEDDLEAEDLVRAMADRANRPRARMAGGEPIREEGWHSAQEFRDLVAVYWSPKFSSRYLPAWAKLVGQIDPEEQVTSGDRFAALLKLLQMWRRKNDKVLVGMAHEEADAGCCTRKIRPAAADFPLGGEQGPLSRDPEDDTFFPIHPELGGLDVGSSENCLTVLNSAAMWDMSRTAAMKAALATTYGEQMHPDNPVHQLMSRLKWCVAASRGEVEQYVPLRSAGDRIFDDYLWPRRNSGDPAAVDEYFGLLRDMYKAYWHEGGGTGARGFLFNWLLRLSEQERFRADEVEDISSPEDDDSSEDLNRENRRRTRRAQRKLRALLTEGLLCEGTSLNPCADAAELTWRQRVYRSAIWFERENFGYTRAGGRVQESDADEDDDSRWQRNPAQRLPIPASAEQDVPFDVLAFVHRLADAEVSPDRLAHDWLEETSLCAACCEGGPCGLEACMENDCFDSECTRAGGCCGPENEPCRYCFLGVCCELTAAACATSARACDALNFVLRKSGSVLVVGWRAGGAAAEKIDCLEPTGQAYRNAMEDHCKALGHEDRAGSDSEEDHGHAIRGAQESGCQVVCNGLIGQPCNAACTILGCLLLRNIFCSLRCAACIPARCLCRVVGSCPVERCFVWVAGCVDRCDKCCDKCTKRLGEGCTVCCKKIEEFTAPCQEKMQEICDDCGECCCKNCKRGCKACGAAIESCWEGTRCCRARCSDCLVGAKDLVMVPVNGMKRFVEKFVCPFVQGVATCARKVGSDACSVVKSVFNSIPAQGKCVIMICCLAAAICYLAQQEGMLVMPGPSSGVGGAPTPGDIVDRSARVGGAEAADEPGFLRGGARRGISESGRRRARRSEAIIFGRPGRSTDFYVQLQVDNCNRYRTRIGDERGEPSPLATPSAAEWRREKVVPSISRLRTNRQLRDGASRGFARFGGIHGAQLVGIRFRGMLSVRLRCNMMR